ncbi:MAG: DNA gyrase subunit A [Bacillota bacterium]
MAKKIVTNLNFEELFDGTKVNKIRVEDEMSKSFISYAMAVNVSRAIPDVRDGLKPVHRRILFGMGNELGLYSDKPHRKCARIVGEVMGKFHPHGDSAIYDALVRMAQDFSIRYTLVDGHGNFGSVDGDSAAAQRYTEARLTKIANEMLRDIDKNTVDFYPNFDNSMLQPRVLPARFPNLLVNGSDGIAVGMATNIPPHNMTEVINATVAQINNPEITVEELMEYIPAPDYPTGGVIMGRAGIRNAYRTGRGGVVIRAKADIEEENGKTKIIVTEIPYQVNKQKLIEHIATLLRDKKIEGLAGVNDESDRHGMRIAIDLKRDANPQVTLNLLYKHTNLQVGNGIILLALVDGEPKILGLKEILACYIAHQQEVVTRRVAFDLARAKEREHIVEGLVIALTNIDEVIKVIKASKDRNEAILSLCENFNLSDRQAKAILEMRLQRLTALEVESLQKELEELKKTIAYLQDLLANPHKIDEIVISDLEEVKMQYGDPRSSEISMDYGDLDIGDLIEEEDIVVTLTAGGYIKRISAAEYRAQNRGGKGIVAHKTKEEDYVQNLIVTSTHQDLLFFSTFGKVYVAKGYEIPEGTRIARGRAMVNMLPVEQEEKISAIIPIESYEEGYLVTITRKGLIKKTAISEYEKIRKGGKIAVAIDEDDSLVTVLKTEEADNLLITSKFGKCIAIKTSDVRPTGRSSKGVKSMNLGADDSIVDMIRLHDENGEKVLTITEKGFGKRTEITDYKIQGRAGKGVKAGKLSDKTGDIVGVKLVRPDQDVIMISSDGTIIRVHADQISVYSRDTQGVKIMNLSESVIASIAVSEREEEVEEAETVEGENAETAENGEVVAVETTETAEAVENTETVESTESNENE